MPKVGITPRAQDYSQWYLDIVSQADLADYSAVRGCMVIKPTGYAIWENIQRELDRRIKVTGHVNAYFPLFIPMSLFMQEAKHVEGFAPEVAVVTRGGSEELTEPLVVRPTSEVIIGSSYAKWIHSWRDLPVLINQWANVVRWEMRTRPFLRTTEFLWQEGHTAHATEEEAEAEALKILHEVYSDFVEKEMALPVLRGRKTEKEKFPGAQRTYSIEAMMQDGRALQAGTSHNFGQNFARAFGITYQTADNRQEYVWTTSWGVSTRLVGALIMAHSDDEGLVIPPRLAPIEVVVVPIYRRDEERAAVLGAIEQVLREWGDRFRVKVDDRDHLKPGFKFNEWELKGVPVRIEIGPEEVNKASAVVARRDIPGKEGKVFIPQAALTDYIARLLSEIQDNLFARALHLREQRTIDVKTYNELKEAVGTGFARAYWAGTNDDEQRIQDETRATIRGLPIGESEAMGRCVYTGKATTQQVIFARAY